MTPAKLTEILAAAVEAERARGQEPRPPYNTRDGRQASERLCLARREGRQAAGQAIAAAFGWRYRYCNAHSPEQVRRGSAWSRHELWRVEECRDDDLPQHFSSNRVFDHVEGFTFNRRPVALLTHPYVPLGEALERVAVYYGLDAYGFANSWYYPGQTCAVLAVRPLFQRDKLATFPWTERRLAETTALHEKWTAPYLALPSPLQGEDK